MFSSIRNSGLFLVSLISTLLISQTLLLLTSATPLPATNYIVSPDSSITAPNNTNGGVIESSATNYFVKFQTKSEYYQNTKSDVDLLMYNLKFAKLDKYVTVGFVYDPNVLNACTIKIDTSSATAAQGTKKNVASIVRYIRQLNFVTSVDPVTSATTNSNNNGGGGSNIGFGEVTANKLPSKENSNPDGTNVFGNAV